MGLLFHPRDNARPTQASASARREERQSKRIHFRPRGDDRALDSGNRVRLVVTL